MKVAINGAALVSVHNQQTSIATMLWRMLGNELFWQRIVKVFASHALFYQIKVGGDKKEPKPGNNNGSLAGWPLLPLKIVETGVRREGGGGGEVSSPRPTKLADFRIQSSLPKLGEPPNLQA
jgi:hypothetical protein